MESLTYNDISMEVIRTNIVSRVAEYADDGMTKLWDKWTIDIKAILNPAATSYATIAGKPVAVGGDGELPGTTDNAIRHNLSMPRQLLTMVAGGVKILESPGKTEGGQRMVCDCKNGPFPEVYSINSMIGSVYWEVGFRITTYVSECKNVDDSRNAVISHSWASAETIDDLFYSTIIISGEAILRADAMHWNSINADEFRRQFFFPVPDNFQREAIQVELSPDGTRLTYSFKDVARNLNLGRDSIIVRADIAQQGGISHGTTARAAMQAAPGLAMATISAGLGLAQVSGAGVGVYQGVMSAARAIINNLPQYWFEVDVQLWGDRNARRSQLTRIALAIAQGQIPLGVGGVSDVAATEIFIQHDRVKNNYVRVRYILSWGDDFRIPLNVLQQGRFQSPNVELAVSGGKAFWLSLFQNPDQDFEVRGNGAQLSRNTAGFRDNPAPPVGGAYGTLIVAMVQQQLGNPCQPPLNPNDRPIPHSLVRNESVITD